MKSFLKITVLTFLICSVLGGGGWFFYAQLKAEDELQKKEDIVWLARCELETLRNDTEVGFLRFSEIAYEDNSLKIKFKSLFVPKQMIEELINVRILKDFMALVALHPDKWMKVSKYLMEAQVDLRIIYSTIDYRPFSLSAKRLKEMLEDKEIMRVAKERFIKYKQKEILSYARLNFKDDRYLHVDTLLLEKGYVTLRLSYNDQRYNLGASYTSTKHVPYHFIDKVGDMGSILNGMLSICVRTGYGFSFMFKGTKRNKIHRSSWSAEQAKEMYHELNDNLWLDRRDPNQSKTIKVRTK